MFSWKEFEKTQSLFSQDSSYRVLGNQHHVTVRPSNLLVWIEMLAEDLGFFMLVELTGFHHEKTSSDKFDYELVYHFLNMGNHQRLNLHLIFNEHEVVPSISPYLYHADWAQREQLEQLAIKFDKQLPPLFTYDEKFNVFPALRSNPNKSEAPYPEESYVWKRHGVLSKETLGLFEWMICFDPVKVVDSKVNIGFYQRGLEQIFEKKDWQQLIQLVDRIHLGASPTYSIALVKNIEESLRIKLPERAQAIRMIFLELARICEHLSVMQELTYALGIDEHRLFLNAREKVHELIEKYAGQRIGLGIVRIGGVREDLPHGWSVEYQSVSEIVTKVLRVVHQCLLSQTKFRQSLSDSEVSAQTALNWGICGPAMRACGLNFDLRKSQPFYFYQDVDFDLPVGIRGTAFERYLVRYEEIFQSFRIITQVVDNLPLGEVINKDYELNYRDLKNRLIEDACPESWSYSGLESPNGEAGFMILYSTEQMFKRIKIKAPSFALAQALPEFIRGVAESHLGAALASLGLRRSELDR
jgi:NADH-quinone oxidoreductase subunit C/D